MNPLTILIVDDEPDLRFVLRSLFEDAGFAVEEAADGAAAQAHCELRLPSVVLTDVRMPAMDGMQLLRALRRTAPDLPVVLLSAVEDVATAVDAIRNGAFDYQQKPYEPERLVHTCRRAAEQHVLKQRLQQANDGARVDFGISEQARELDRMITLLASQPSLSALLVGESGVGKEVVARQIHARSPAPAGPFVAIDCGALPEPLLESQLFGHRRGAFTGADRDRQGLFAQADGGTLFLDELGNLPLALQQKLLRALQERAVTPVGGDAPVPFRARLICATNADLQDDVRQGRFRIDLYHRIAEFTLPIAPLRARPADIAHFADRFLAEANRELGRNVEAFSPGAGRWLQAQPWPGNLRELRNAIRRAVLLCSDRLLDVDLLCQRAMEPPTPDADAPDLPLAERLRRHAARRQLEILQSTLAQCGGNKAEAARRLQIDYTTLHRKLKRHGLLGMATLP